MAIKKYINTKEAAELTGQPYEEIVRLARTGVLPSHKTRRGHYRLNVDAVEKCFGIQINKPEETVDKPQKVIDRPIFIKETPNTSCKMRLIIENHYQEFIKLINAAKSSIKIMTADFKLIKLKSTTRKNFEERTSFIRDLMERAEHGISVQIICSDPSKYFKEEYEELRKRMNTDNFRIYFCIRNHAKVVIIDDKTAYLGSANFTKAGVGQGVLSKGNFEVGIMTENQEIISSLKAHFTKIMNGDYCEGCHRAKKCPEY